MFVKWLLLIMVADMVISYIFYRSFIAFLIFLLPMHGYFTIIRNYVVKRRKQEVTIQFKELCNSLCAQLVAGYSLENSLRESYTEVCQMYGDQAWISREVRGMIGKLKLNVTIEECFRDFGERSGIEEIKLFAQIIRTAKRSGGDVIEIVKNASDTIRQKIEVEREIRIIINAKKYEQRIMDIVPLLIVVYVEFTSGEMMKVMYQGLFGRLVMTVCLIIYVTALILGEKMTQIEL